MSARLDQFKASHDLEISMEWGKWRNEIPFLRFLNEWEVRVIPPITGAVVRFIVKMGEAEVSVYLDCYENLGMFGEPYWEIYPYEDDTFRCKMADTDALIEAIGHSLKEQSASATKATKE
jgi:hypothetical protein